MPNSSRGGTCSALEGHEVAGSEACLEKANEALRSELAAGSSSAAEKAADAFAAWLARPGALMQAQREVWRAEATLAKLSKAEEDVSAARRAGAALPLALAPMHCGRTLTTHPHVNCSCRSLFSWS